MSFVLDMKIKLPKNAIVAIDNTNTVILSKTRWPSIRLATNLMIP